MMLNMNFAHLCSHLSQVEILLPYPDEKCVNNPVLLPRLSCQQVEDRHCMAVPVVREGLSISVTKCEVNYKDEECLESVLSLPRQACPTKVGPYLGKLIVITLF